MAPPKGQPSSLKAGERIIVEVKFKYDSGILGFDDTITTMWALEIESDSKVRLIGQVSDITLPPREMRPE
jgi:hypothetical protein